MLKVQLSPPSAPRPGAPEAHHQAAGCINHQPGQQRRRHHRGPEEAARRGTWKKHKQARNPELQPTPPPAAPSRRLVTVVREKTRSRSSFCQLDGKAGDKLMVDTATSSPPSFPPTPTSLASPFTPVHHRHLLLQGPVLLQHLLRHHQYLKMLIVRISP